MRIRKSMLYYWTFIFVVQLLFILWYRGYFSDNPGPDPPPPLPDYIEVTPEEKELIESGLSFVRDEWNDQTITSLVEVREGVAFMIATVNLDVKEQVLRFFENDAELPAAFDTVLGKLRVLR